MNKLILNIIVCLATILTGLAYLVFDSLEIKALVTLLDVPVIYLMIIHMKND